VERRAICTYSHSAFDPGDPRNWPSLLPATLSTEATRISRSEALSLGQVPDKLLWYYYLSYTSETFAESDSDCRAYADMWQVAFPAVAHEDQATSHALLALSALCMSKNDTRLGGEFLDYEGTANMHYYQSLKHLQSSVTNVTRDSADALLACAMLLIPYGGTLPPTQSNIMGEWMAHMRGFRSLGSAVEAERGVTPSTDQLIPFPQDGMPDWRMRVMKTRHTVSDYRVRLLFRAIQRTRYDALRTLESAVLVADCSAADTEAYLSAINELQYIMDYLFDFRVSNYLRATFSWITQVSDEFIQLLTGHDGIALAIAAHWLVCTMLLCQFWYIRDFGAVRIRLIAQRPDLQDGDLSCLVNWPLEMLQTFETA
jgi:hypothetical protein